MRAVVVSAIALGVVAIIGAGVVVTRFVLKINPENTTDEYSTQSHISNETGETQLDLSNLLAGQANDTSMLPNQNQAIAINANSEALAAQQAVAGCLLNVSKKIPIKDWATSGLVVASALGDDCYNSIVRIAIKSSDGKVLFSMAAPGRDFGISPTDDKSVLQNAITASLPDSAIHAAAYPAWINDEDMPYGTEFSRDAYQKAREKNIPVICVKVPSAPQTCVAYDAATDKMKTLQRG
jgi:hypothetical protein